MPAPLPSENPHWPAYFYPHDTDPENPTEKGRVFQQAEDVPEGWAHHWGLHGHNLNREPPPAPTPRLTRPRAARGADQARHRLSAHRRRRGAAEAARRGGGRGRLDAAGLRRHDRGPGHRHQGLSRAQRHRDRHAALDAQNAEGLDRAERDPAHHLRLGDGRAAGRLAGALDTAHRAGGRQLPAATLPARHRRQCHVAAAVERRFGTAVYPYPPKNSRIVFAGTRNQTVWFPEQPDDGSRMGLIQGATGRATVLP
jgi:hypothetical protein